MEKTLKIGDRFVYDDVTLTLRETLFDSNDELWAIALDDEGAPWTVREEDIANETVTIVVMLPKPPKVKKGKK